MQTLEVQPLDLSLVEVKSFDCGQEDVNTYLRRYAAKNMKSNVNRTYVHTASNEEASKASVVAYYTMAHHTLYRDSLPDPKGLPRYPLPVVLLAWLGVDKRFQGKGMGARLLVRALRHACRVVSDPDGIPALGVALDVLDQDAMRFYESFGLFIPLADNPKRLFAPMESLETV